MACEEIMARRTYISCEDGDLAAVREIRRTVGHPYTGIEFVDRIQGKCPFHLPEAEAVRMQVLDRMREVVVTVCMIGGATHSSPWVGWEIETAVSLGHGLVGVRLRTGVHDFIPRALQAVHAQIVDTHVPSIMASIERAAFVAGCGR